MSISLFLFITVFLSALYLSITKHPIWGLFAYTLALYTNPLFHWWGGPLPNLRWSLLSALVTLVSIFLQKHVLVPKNPWYSSMGAKLLIVFIIWLWIQLPWALAFDTHLGLCILYTKYLVLFYMVYTILDSDWTFFLFINFNILGGFYWGKLIREVSYSGRIEGLGGPGVRDANTLGMQMVVILIFASLMLLKKNTLSIQPMKWKLFRLVSFIAVAFIANGVVQTISRSAILGMVAAGMILIFINAKEVRKKLYLYAVLALAGFLTMAPNTFWERMGTVKEAAEGGEVESSAYSRLVIGRAQLKMFKENILGNGHRGTAELSPYYLPKEYLTARRGQVAQRSSHCTFLTVLVEQGVPGVIMYWLMVFWVVAIALSFSKRYPIIYLYMMMAVAALAAVFVAGIFVDYLKVEIQIYLFAMLASLKEWERRLIYQDMSQEAP